MTMFVISEVHPFKDGNGRTARLAMNCVLSAVPVTHHRTDAFNVAKITCCR